MKTYQKLLKRLGHFTAQASLVAVVALGLPRVALAANVTVDCTGGPADFGSITAALNALDLQGPHTIFLAPGTCVESVVIEDRERLTIDARPHGTQIQSADGFHDTITIINSHGVELFQVGAVFGKTGIAIGQSSEVLLAGVTSEVNGDGVIVTENSTLRYEGGLVQTNDRDGLIVIEGSVARADGVNFQSNPGSGISVFANSRIQVHNSLLSNNSIRGLSLDNGGSAQVLNTQIHDNGNLGPAFGAGGILALRKSEFGLIASDVSNNRGFGVVVRDNSSAVLVDNTINANSAGGVIALILSVARLAGTNIITGNGNTDLTCTISSFAYGNRSGVGKLLCPGFGTDPFPGTLK